MTKAQIKWASEHDWFDGSMGGSVYVIEYIYNQRTETAKEVLKTFDDFKLLREWAGY